MNDNNIGGISLDDIMSAAGVGLDDEPVEEQPVDSGTDRTPSADDGLADGVNKISGKKSDSGFDVKKEPAPIKNTEHKGEQGASGGSLLGKGLIPEPSGVSKNPDPEGKTDAVSDTDLRTGKKDPFFDVLNKLSQKYMQMVVDIGEYINRGQTAQAASMAQELVDHNVSSELAWLAYAKAKLAWGDKELARKGFEQAIAINPKFADALDEFGQFLMDCGEFDSALTLFERALECDPSNSFYMANVVYATGDSESKEAAIEKCKHFIEISEDKTYLQNVLGVCYVVLSSEYLVELPVDFDNPDAGTTLGFISFEDIQEVRKLCNEAKSLLTLDEFNNTLEQANEYLDVCDLNCQLIPAHEKSYRIFHSVIVCLFYSIITLFWGLPIAIAIAVVTYKADEFPMYMINYVLCKGEDDPLKYTSDSFYKNHEILKAAMDGAKSGLDSTDSDDSILKGIFHEQYWLFKARIVYYKRAIQKFKEKRKAPKEELKVDDIVDMDDIRAED